MANKDSKVKISFIATDEQITGAITRIESKLNSLEKSANTTATALSFQALQQGIQTLERFGQAVLDVANKGASFALLENEFGKLTRAAGENSKQVLEGLQEASKQAISQRDLILASNKANLLGVADTEKELTDLMEIAVARGDKLGVSTTQAFDNIVTGLGRQSALILDNLGIIIDTESAQKRYAESIGKTVKELTEQEKKQALVNAVIADSQSLLSGGLSVQSENQSKIESLSAAWQDFTDTLAAQTVPTLALVADALANVIRSGTEYLNEGDINRYTDLLDRARQEVAKGNGDTKVTADMGIGERLMSDIEAVKMYTNFLNEAGVESATMSEIVTILSRKIFDLKGVTDSTSESVIQWGTDSIDAAENARVLEQATEKVSLKNELFQEKLRLSQTELYTLATASGMAASQLHGLEIQLQSMTLANSAFEAGVGTATNKIIAQAVAAQKLVGYEEAKRRGQDALNFLNIETNKLQTNLENTELSALDVSLQIAAIEDQAISPFTAIQDANKAAQQQMKESGKAVRDLAKESDQAFNDLKSKVSSVLSGALNVDVGVNPEDILPREDAINENARRLADVAVKGYQSPWFEFFKNEFPDLFVMAFQGRTEDDVKIQAAKILKNFQDGLVPELIDKETAKERVRRALIGEQKMEELAKEIALELSSELGTNLQSTADIANSILTGKSNGQSITINAPTIDSTQLEGIPTEFENSFKNSFIDFSERFSAMLVDVFSAKIVLETSSNGGKINGQNWGSGFKETVGEDIPDYLLDLLSLRILPRIEGALKESQNRESSR